MKSRRGCSGEVVVIGITVSMTWIFEFCSRGWHIGSVSTVHHTNLLQYTCIWNTIPYMFSFLVDICVQYMYSAPL